MGMKEQAEATTRWMIARIEEALASGEKLNWATGHENGLPVNFTTGKFYRGWNVFRCWMAGFERPLFAGAGQIKAAGGRVKREEWSAPTWIQLWTKRELDEIDPRTGLKRVYWYSKALKVWNVEQCDGLDEDKLARIKRPTGAESDEALDEFFGEAASADGFTVREGASALPCYAFTVDEVRMPDRAAYHGGKRYYADLAHEFVHATGHESRLDRGLFAHGREDYSKEELVAEFGAAMLGAMLGFDGGKEAENSAAYLRGWLRALGDDPTLLASAASAAQKAVDRIMEKAGALAPAEADPAMAD